ncbi:MAG TPA: dethiobiotin synthase [Gammaproteobacteria bacterium]|nr:dethiobiotin synthase [Gammaproteobacteria bacterium]
MKGFFVTGTDTGIGKTRVSAGLLKALSKSGLKTVGMKPVASGAEPTPEGLRNDDALALQKAASERRDYALVNPYCFAPPVAPHLAAREAGVEISLDVLRAAYGELCRGVDAVVVEGVGGWQVPLASGLEVPDLAREFDLPVLLVVGMRLGCLNHALLTARAIRGDGLELAGWVANAIDPEFQRPEANLATLEAELGAPLLGRLAYAPKVSLAETAGGLTEAVAALAPVGR